MVRHRQEVEVCYTTFTVQTPFYTSGFLYNLKTNKILLLKSQLKDSADFLWSTLGGDGSEVEDAKVAFGRVINGLLNINLKPKDIFPIYDYFHEGQDKSNFVFYALVKNIKDFNAFDGNAFSWVGFDQIPKLLFTEHSKQDVIVGERVIKLKSREDEAKKSALDGTNLV